MLIKFSSNFEKLTGKNHLFVKLKEPIALEKVFILISKEIDLFKNYTENKKECFIGAHILVLRLGVPLNLKDLINNDDVLQILMPVTGG